MLFLYLGVNTEIEAEIPNLCAIFILKANVFSVQ